MHRSHVLVLALAVGVLAGCVSQGKYDDLEAKASAERAALGKDVATLREEITRREAEIATLKGQTADLENRKRTLESQTAGKSACATLTTTT